MEYLLLVGEFFYVKGKEILVYLFLPVIIGLLIYYKSDNCIYEANLSAFHTNIVTILGILIGFTISSLTMLLTVSNANIEKAKGKSLKIIVFKKEISLYDKVVMGLAYIIIVQGFLLIGNFIYPIFIPIESNLGRILFSINISIVVHIILILMRSILDFYFIITKKDDSII